MYIAKHMPTTKNSWLRIKEGHRNYNNTRILTSERYEIDFLVQTAQGQKNYSKLSGIMRIKILWLEKIEHCWQG